MDGVKVCYEMTPGFVAIEMDHEVPDNVLDPSWAWFGSDLFGADRAFGRRVDELVSEMNAEQKRLARADDWNARIGLDGPRGEAEDERR